MEEEDRMVREHEARKVIHSLPPLLTAAKIGKRANLLRGEGCNIFELENFLSPEECRALIKCTEACGYETLEGLYPSTLRNHRRVLARGAEVQSELFARLGQGLTAEDSLCVRPTACTGVWHPTPLNDCIKFARYGPAQRFRPHCDAKWEESETEATIYTVLVYLNEGFSGGRTLFYGSASHLLDTAEKGCGEIDPAALPPAKVAIMPRTGNAVVFNHDVIHEGEVVECGTKYVLRCEIVFKCLQVPPAPASTVDDREVTQLFDHSFRERALHAGRVAQGNTVDTDSIPAFTASHHAAVLLEARRGSIPAEFPVRILKATAQTLPVEVLVRCLTCLTPAELCSVSLVSQAFLTLARDSYLWEAIYRDRYGLVFPGVERARNRYKRSKASKKRQQHHQEAPAGWQWFLLYSQRAEQNALRTTELRTVKQPTCSTEGLKNFAVGDYYLHSSKDPAVTKIISIARSKCNSKNGSKKVHLVSEDVLTGKRREDMLSGYSIIPRPVVVISLAELIDVTEDGTVCVLTETNEPFECGLPVNDVGRQLEQRFAQGKPTIVELHTICEPNDCSDSELPLPAAQIQAVTIVAAVYNSC
eukprot:TRINITY_DN3979_c0_g1_i5.p1 TRINITY_DN3979_c0_g1~~TRINITY_DN3979_c0_g1_i5.p1  ORF type:complete len:598 (-),score=84.68 TRINITY_DN3979_c0_g1_i5:209-1975(-)